MTAPLCYGLRREGARPAEVHKILGWLWVAGRPTPPLTSWPGQAIFVTEQRDMQTEPALLEPRLKVATVLASHVEACARIPVLLYRAGCVASFHGSRIAYFRCS